MRFWHLNHDIAKSQTTGTLRLPSWFFTIIFFCLLLILRLKVFRSITFKCLHDSNTKFNDGAVQGARVFVWVLLRDISDLIQLSRTVQSTYFIIYEFCFTCFKVEYKRTYIFQSSSNETLIIDIQIWTLIRKYAAYKLWFQKFILKGSFFFCESCTE